jgi:hypothetical protein
VAPTASRVLAPPAVELGLDLLDGIASRLP